MEGVQNDVIMKGVARSILGLWVLSLLTTASGADPVGRAPMIVDLSSMPSGAKPAGFTEALTGHGGPVRWLVLDDQSAPTGGKVLAETSNDTADYRFPLCIYDSLTVRDVSVSVRFKPVAGTVDQAGGIIVRAQDDQNYYVARANALEDNVRLYKVVAGQRRQIAGHNTKVAAGRWHTLALKVEGDLLEVVFDGIRVIQTHDATFAGPGKVGLWTKADSLTYFNELTILAGEK
jgi:hypothetical protein